jgi:isoleucyl-tRNA synthetase
LTGKAPFKALFGYETLKDEKGEDMHKSKGNAIWFDDAVERVGADPIRLLYCLQDPSLDLRFGYTTLKEPTNNINILYNMRRLIENVSGRHVKRIEDKWILSKLNNLKKYVTEEFEKLHPHNVTRALKDFWLNDLSRSYIQIIRERLSDNDKEAKYVLNHVYVELLKLCAPIIPFISEKIWLDLVDQKVVREESVHLTDWPKSNNKYINIKLEKDFELAFDIIEKGLAERDKVKIGLKWPLGKATVTTEKNISKELLSIIEKQLNVRKVDIKNGRILDIHIDTKMTPELEAEGYAREISRKIQESRKKSGLVKKDKIDLVIVVDKKFEELIKSQVKLIGDRTSAKSVKFNYSDGGKHNNIYEFEIKGEKITILFSKT